MKGTITDLEALRDEKAREDYKKARKRLPVSIPCPDCGDVGPHDTNGSKYDPAFCCSGCGMHHDVQAPEADS